MPFCRHRNDARRIYAALPILCFAALLLSITAASGCKRKEPILPAPQNEAERQSPADSTPTDPADIPECPAYVLRCTGDTLCVYDDTSHLLFRTALPRSDILTSADRDVLERDGYTYTSRPALLEFLFSLETPNGV